MNVCRPLRAGLFYYECLRFLLLIVLLLQSPLESGDGGGVPYLAYLSSNVLFPLIALFVWLRPEEYRSYLTLHIAGKTISIILFYLWEFLAAGQVQGAEYLMKNMTLFGGSILLSFADILSVFGAWMLKNKFRRVLVQLTERSGLTEYGGI